MPKISIIIPVFNEEKSIVSCLNSLAKQTTAKETEIIIVDDGSSDGTLGQISNINSRMPNLRLLKQKHQGPGAARNLGADEAKGKVLVFVDADMEFAPDFIEKLIAPIDGEEVVGTFSKEEYLLNKDKPLARCWNLNFGRTASSMKPSDFSDGGKSIWSKTKSFYKNLEKGSKENRQSDRGHVFRAILKSKFDSVNGFDATLGYTDDWSIAEKLHTLAVPAPGAVYYHRNPETLTEVWKQARWFGKNEFLTRNLVRQVFNLCRYNGLTGLLVGVYGWFKFNEPIFVVFKVVFDTAVFVSVLLSFVNEPKSK